MTWHTAPELLVAWQREQWPAGYYNVGVAHGVPGAVAMLGSVAALPDPDLAATRARARELCAGATRWLRAQRVPPDPRGRFPMVVEPDPAASEPGRRAPAPTRTAWCYGDPGIAAAAWSAALRTGGDPAEWRELAREAARRPPGLCGVVDSGLCHGAAGLGHLYNRFYQATGDAGFRDAARGWFERALAMRRPGEGIAGFTLHRPGAQPGEAPTRETSQQLLEGASGIGLALLAATHPEEPGWDRLLLCDVPVRARE